MNEYVYLAHSARFTKSLKVQNSYTLSHFHNKYFMKHDYWPPEKPYTL